MYCNFFHSPCAATSAACAPPPVGWSVADSHWKCAGAASADPENLCYTRTDPHRSGTGPCTWGTFCSDSFFPIQESRTDCYIIPTVISRLRHTTLQKVLSVCEGKCFGFALLHPLVFREKICNNKAKTERCVFIKHGAHESLLNKL